MDTNYKIIVTQSVALVQAGALAMSDLPAALEAFERSTGSSESSRVEVAELVATILMSAGVPERMAATAMDALVPVGGGE